jgi:hypothetical protein
LKNLLTNGTESDIIDRLSARQQIKKRDGRGKPRPDGSLTIEQQEIEVQAKSECEISEIL